MAHLYIYIDGLPGFTVLKTGDFPWQTVSHNQRVAMEQLGNPSSIRCMEHDVILMFALMAVRHRCSNVVMILVVQWHGVLFLSASQSTILFNKQPRVN